MSEPDDGARNLSEVPATTGASQTSAPRDRWWRHGHWPSRKIDRFVVSFPKAGRTWLRVLMAVAEARARGDDPARVVGQWMADDAPLLGGRPVLFTHALAANELERPEAIEHFLGYIGDRRRLFLVRDPRDVVVSYFFHVTRRHRGDAPRDLTGFVRDPRFGIDRILAFLRAVERSLADDPGPACVVSYEGLHDDPVGELGSTLRFFGGVPTDEALEEAVAFGSFENLRRFELEETYPDPDRRLLAFDPRDPESFKTRRGVVGSYREYLEGADLAFVEDRIAELLPAGLGYRIPGVPPPAPARGAIGARA